MTSRPVTYKSLLTLLGAMILAGLGLLGAAEARHSNEIENDRERVFKRLERIEEKIDRVLENAR